MCFNSNYSPVIKDTADVFCTVLFRICLSILLVAFFQSSIRNEKAFPTFSWRLNLNPLNLIFVHPSLRLSNPALQLEGSDFNSEI